MGLNDQAIVDDMHLLFTNEKVFYKSAASKNSRKMCTKRFCCWRSLEVLFYQGVRL